MAALWHGPPGVPPAQGMLWRLSMLPTRSPSQRRSSGSTACTGDALALVNAAHAFPLPETDLREYPPHRGRLCLFHVYQRALNPETVLRECRAHRGRVCPLSQLYNNPHAHGRSSGSTARAGDA
ncbi:hypothetical protein BD311DRAFT_812724 [Dichomitus squalens]|uniref:Uncharacterized protein n=1 Tax=Dichomitus squalens TaxID=114155 RepID=A0A4Q9M2W8_9APHY|nr:hypothetical protein BD311DRAFT_812724 [Dichomitus squalens]